MTDLRDSITSHLKEMVSAPLREASLSLLKTLGYESDKTIASEDSSPQAFLDLIEANNPGSGFSEEKALVSDWLSADLLFQLTDEEISKENTLFEDREVKPGLMKSYIFFALELNGASAVNGAYARGKLTAIARQINRAFPMPVMVLIKHQDASGVAVLSIAVINRRQNKRESYKDVLSKVTIIRDVSLNDAHRGHLDILNSFAFAHLKHPQKLAIIDFDTLHAAWEEIFNIELLNKRFYKELANWYFWAMQNCRFPFEDAEKDKDDLLSDTAQVREHDAKNLIRLLTRTLFVWFIKERSLVPDSLFHPSDLEESILTSFDPESKETHYYKAVLQNLFFATLNQTHGKREFRKDGQHHNTTNLLRYRDRLQSPGEFIAMLEASTPFLNGGLFDCLDYPHLTKKGKQGGAITVYEDGFSDRKDNPLHLPDFLFFGKERSVDLSGDDAYGTASCNKEKVRGLINILNRYKFTIVENTPIDQEIALDPELLGQVFENLLASYNPETKTTARKQTGSFYTPRPIVDYMVDESLKAHLCKALQFEAKMEEEDAKAGLDLLFTYTEKEHPFTAAEVTILIRAIDCCKILDPACGSGAFPMGVLQKLVYILSKLDPDNQGWKEAQLDKLDSSTMRESLEADFADNDDDYGRKLYLIENCLYGVDIQSIATQVSKLRFFISLIVDQHVDKSKENFGVRPLPNLETKFVTANTLISLDKPEAQGELAETADISELQRQLKRVRHALFTAKTPKTKNKYREEDKRLREEIAKELENNGWGGESAQALATWDPYDQNASSAYFDPEWMFGEKGFDIVIQNPPYISHDKLDHVTKTAIRSYKCWEPYADAYCYFIEVANRLMNPQGISCSITSNSFLRADYGHPIRELITSSSYISSVTSIDRSQVFENAIVNVAILIFKKEAGGNRFQACRNSWAGRDFENHIEKNSFRANSERLERGVWALTTGEEDGILNFIEQQPHNLELLGAKIRLGLATGSNGAFIINGDQYEEFTRDSPNTEEILKPVIRGRNVDRYNLDQISEYLILSKNGIDIPNDYPSIFSHLDSFGDKFRNRGARGQKWWNLRACSFYSDFEKDRVVWIEMTNTPRFTICPAGVYMLNTAYFLLPPKGWEAQEIVAILNSSVSGFYMKHTAQTSGMGITRWFKEHVSSIPLPELEQSVKAVLYTLSALRLRTSMDVADQFLEDLIDACVMECYFHEHMAERDLLFHDELAPHLAAYDSKSSDTQQRDFLTHLHSTLNAPESDIRKRLDFICKKSPDLLAIIKQEGKV